MVVAKAGSSVSSRVAENFLEANWNGDLAKGQRLAEDVYKKEFGNLIDNEPLARQHPTLLIVVRHRERRLLHFCVRTRTEVSEVQDKIISGDGSNSGVLVLERYYRDSMGFPDVKRIAALAVWFTGKLNPYVGGLEMIEFPFDGKPRPLDDQEIEELQKWCETTDERLRHLVTSHD